MTQAGGPHLTAERAFGPDQAWWEGRGQLGRVHQTPGRPECLRSSIHLSTRLFIPQTTSLVPGTLLGSGDSMGDTKAVLMG